MIRLKAHGGRSRASRRFPMTKILRKRVFLNSPVWENALGLAKAVASYRDGLPESSRQVNCTGRGVTANEPVVSGGLALQH
jgi:hypothetical protein